MELRVPGHLPADVDPGELPGRRPGLHAAVGTAGDPPVHDQAGREADPGGQGARGLAADVQDGDRADTSRVDREIVDKASNKTDFDATIQGSFGDEGSYKTDYTARAGGEAAAQSERVKKDFHEAVLKSAEEYKQQHRTEIDTTTSEETEETTFHEIPNPNDELTVTYMFYELQRRFLVGERIHQLTPVILLANKVPAPSEIDDAWLTEHDWILRRVILDDSFRPALDYLTKSFVGAELNIKILETNAEAQKQVVDDIKDAADGTERHPGTGPKGLGDEGGCSGRAADHGELPDQREEGLRPLRPRRQEGGRHLGGRADGTSTSPRRPSTVPNANGPGCWTRSRPPRTCCRSPSTSCPQRSRTTTNGSRRSTGSGCM